MNSQSAVNSYDLMMSLFSGKKVDTPAVLPWVREWCSKQAGHDFTEELNSVERHVYAQTYCIGRFQYDGVFDMFGCSSESEAMGSELKIKRGEVPSIENPAVNDYEKDLPRLRLFDPYRNERLATILEGTRRLKARFGGEVPVIGYVQGPMRHASMLRGTERLLRDMYKQKENLRKMIEIVIDSLIVYAVAVISAGVDIIIIGDPSSSGSAISKKQYMEWGFEPTIRLIDRIKRSGVKTILHICGDTLDRLEELASTGADCLSLDEAVDFEAARKALGPGMVLMGNVSPTLLAIGTPEEVKAATRKIIEKGGKDGNLIVSSGCVVPDIVPPENIRAMVDATREYRAA
jgi:uroporphyrinogen decarboxylase